MEWSGKLWGTTTARHDDSHWLDKADMVVVSIGTAGDGRLLEESPLAVHLQKGPNRSN